jgi:PhnB protein
MTIKPVPDSYHSVTPWIIVKGAADLIDYLKRAFGAEELGRVPNPDGTLGHAEVRIGDSVVMMFDARDGWPETPAFMRLYVPDGDEAFQSAIDAGGTAVTEMTDLFFGDRVGRVRDPFGNLWWIQTRVEEVAPDEMMKRAQDPANADAMKRVEQSLNEEMRSRAS